MIVILGLCFLLGGEGGRWFEIGRPRSRGYMDNGARGLGGLENWTIFTDVICVSYLI